MSLPLDVSLFIVALIFLGWFLAHLIEDDTKGRDESPDQFVAPTVWRKDQ